MSWRTPTAFCVVVVVLSRSHAPRFGDLIIKDRNNRFVVSRVGKHNPLGPATDSLAEALKLALETVPGAAIWRENADDRGRPLGPAIQIHPSPR